MDFLTNIVGYSQHNWHIMMVSQQLNFLVLTLIMRTGRHAERKKQILQSYKVCWHKLERLLSRGQSGPWLWNCAYISVTYSLVLGFLCICFLMNEIDHIMLGFLKAMVQKLLCISSGAHIDNLCMYSPLKLSNDDLSEALDFVHGCHFF